jgi:hypothetical protein
MFQAGGTVFAGVLEAKRAGAADVTHHFQECAGGVAEGAACGVHEADPALHAHLFDADFAEGALASARLGVRRIP